MIPIGDGEVHEQGKGMTSVESNGDAGVFNFGRPEEEEPQP
jgi:hypothetical protein